MPKHSRSKSRGGKFEGGAKRKSHAKADKVGKKKSRSKSRGHKKSRSRSRSHKK